MTNSYKFSRRRQRSEIHLPHGHFHPGLRILARTTILVTIVMATSVHLPKNLLEAVDRKARALHISRNRLVVQALERDLRGGSGWSPEFFDRLTDVDPNTSEDIEALLQTVLKSRKSKPARQL